METKLKEEETLAFQSSPEIERLPPADGDLNFARRHGDRIGAQMIGFAGATGLAVAWLMAKQLEITLPSLLLVLFSGCVALPMILLSLFNRSQLRLSSGLKTEAGQIHWARCRSKLIGFLSTLLMLAVLYWLFPEYKKDFYGPVWGAFSWMGLPLLLLTFPYIVWVDRRMMEPEDGYFQMGLLAAGKWSQVDRPILKNYLLGWLVKGFFLPLMLAGAVEHLELLLKEGVNWGSFGYLYSTSLNLILGLDVIFGAVGYILTLRITDSHIRSPEPTCMGWVSALICYMPLSGFFWSTFLKYKAETNWGEWLSPYPILFISWGFIIIVLHVVYVWSTLSFGCRFSNLTNRGIIVDGPYRYMKHPAYVSKNIAWWLMAVPFVAHSTWQEALRACICLGLTNFIYVLRAWTEERHLMKDPAYRVYSDWMKENSLFSLLKGLARRGWPEGKF